MSGRRHLHIAVAACWVFVTALPAASQTVADSLSKRPAEQEKSADYRSTPVVVRLDSNLVFTQLDEDRVLAQRLKQNTARPLTGYLSVSADRFYGIEHYELSKFQCAVLGADKGLTLGLIAGALGMTAGLWDERASWYIAGAAAALGILRGSSMADEPQFRVRIRWDDGDREPGSR